MSEYRRFISYIYDYHDGKKRNNCGYVKVEIRNDICRLGLHLEARGSACKEVQVYGFVRIQGKALGIRAGNAAQRGNAWEMQASMSAQRFAMSEYKIEDIKGIWIRTDAGENFITVWDDEAVEPDMFVTRLPDPEQEEVLQAQETQPQNMQPQNMQLQNMQPQNPQLQNPQPAPEERAASKSLAMRWDNFLYHYPQITPFDDGEIRECICIAPKDLSFLPREERQFCANPFLREGYENYGHLLLGCHEQGRYVLAVPGMSGEMQDKHLARMCGFPMFKQARDSSQAGYGENEKGVFGYWYHFLNEECPPDKK